MSDQLPVLIVLLPLFGALLVILLGMVNRGICVNVVIGTLGVTAIAAISTLMKVIQAPGFTISYRLGNWEPLVGIEYRIDRLAAFVLLSVSSMAVVKP